ncbi:MAG: cytidylate kinase-like family protein, partial [Verrucomicrobia bacterium]
PGSWAVIEQTTETILKLAELGHVIIVGRAANIITADIRGVFHVRLVAPLEQRVRHAEEFYSLSPREARDFCQREDLGRQRYLKKYFKRRVDDPLLYHLTINTGLVSYDQAAALIVAAARKEAGLTDGVAKVSRGE